MGEYTDGFERKEYSISPEDDNYAEELLEVVKSFRSFDVALTEFIVHKGYDGDPENAEEKMKFIRERFNAAGISLDSRTTKKWFYEHRRGTDRKIAFQFCFAFELNLEETQNFFRKVYLQRGIDCHDIREAIYYYCISNHISYTGTMKLMQEAPELRKGNIDFSQDVLFTGSIVKELDRFESTDELMEFLRENSGQFGYNNATAYKYITELWKKISGPDGLAEKEDELHLPWKKRAEKKRSVWDIYLQIYGLRDFDENDDGSRVFDIKGSRTIQQILRDNQLLHPVAVDSFPDRQGLEGILRGEHQSFEVVRKVMILLGFYRFWTTLAVKSREYVYSPRNNESERCISEINRLLVDSGYPALYEGNPYDWIFLYCSQDPECPREAFRIYMRELFLAKEEGKDIGKTTL